MPPTIYQLTQLHIAEALLFSNRYVFLAV